ncbi:MAG: hypothetical protein EOP85_04390 [Verrucomicrobiaceae bacterium]|nr:MAG: hypothetical protein EOP85_04390 [Verrucomicrobiaceae bacterium]
MICPSSRAGALRQLEEFIPFAGLYARDRNHVRPGHAGVSRLSPAIRHRLITEAEVTAAVLRAHSFGRVEKFVQEVYWRRYWKSWLSLRPEVWDRYLADLEEERNPALAEEIEGGNSGNAVIDHFARELVETGYLHNHSRMWLAAWWVHEARLSWQSGAAFFFRHLLDADPASNTLSWRWVAGWQTLGKTYLARRSNLEKYLDPDVLAGLADGLPAFENPRELSPGPITKVPITKPEVEQEIPDPGLKTGLWIHEEDLSVETSHLKSKDFSNIVVTADVENWERLSLPTNKRKWISGALADAAKRAGEAWNVPVMWESQARQHQALREWAVAGNLQQVVAMRPEVGPLMDSLEATRAALHEKGIRLVLVDREEDLRIRPFATAGFFPFWERTLELLKKELPEPEKSASC